MYENGRVLSSVLTNLIEGFEIKEDEIVGYDEVDDPEDL
jgi:hypothetical protein